MHDAPSHELARYLIEAHELVLGHPCPIPPEQVGAELDEVLRLIEEPRERLRSVLAFAIEHCRVQGELLTSLRFLRRYVFADRLASRRLVAETLRGHQVTAAPHESPLGEEDLVDGFLRHIKVEEGKTSHTLRSYGESIAVLRAFIGERRLGLRDFGRDDLIAFKEHLIERGNTARTVNMRLAAVAALTRYLLLMHEIQSDPARGVRRLPEQHRRLSVLSAAEVEQLLAVIDTSAPAGARDHMMVMMLFATGGRIGEVTALRVEDVDLERAAVTFRNRKNKRDLVVCLPDPCLAPLRRYLTEVRPQLAARAVPPADGLLFLSVRGGPVNRSSVSRPLKQYAKRAGIAKPISSHTFRRSVATIMANNDMPAELIRGFLGHESVDTTLRNYVSYSDASQRRAVEEFHPLSEQRWGGARRRGKRADGGPRG